MNIELANRFTGIEVNCTSNYGKQIQVPVLAPIQIENRLRAKRFVGTHETGFTV